MRFQSNANVIKIEPNICAPVLLNLNLLRKCDKMK